MWSDESRFTQFQSDGHIRVRREADGAPIVPTAYLQASGGSCDVRLLQLSGPASATLCAQRIRAADYLNIVNDRVIPSMDFSP